MVNVYDECIESAFPDYGQMRPQHSYCPSSEGIFAVHTPIKSPEPSTDLGLGAAVGGYLTTVANRVLVVGSGGLSHDPPMPTLATASPSALERIVHGRPLTPEQRRARQVAVMEAAHHFAHGESQQQPLNPAWDHRLLEILDHGHLADLDSWSNSWITHEAGNSAHEIRTWVAAFAALATQGAYKTLLRYYRPAPELIAAFAVRTAVPA
ncbi:hypothetical protein [Mycobacterium xenopi]|uniref:DODA-type extradiol aromatic ring-opening family dioxygenase n=1 Tax=Mycobacterium xenopi TaxID=1789 RepID=UPI003B8A5B53